MSVINSIPLIAAGDDGYQISRSVRLRSSASAYFNRTPASSGNRQVMTFSWWMKLGNTAGSVFGAPSTTNPRMQLYYNGPSDGRFELYQSNGGGTQVFYTLTSARYRDPSAWYHFIVAIDTTQGTASNRIKWYVNGVQLTAFDTAAYPAQNTNMEWNAAAIHNIGRQPNGGSYFDGYLTEINFIDGQALTPSSFGETNSITGVWQPKKYAGTYGTNGFYLNFSDNSNNTATTIGKDYSGNGNNWTPNNISVTAGATYDSMLDVPTPYADGGNGRGNYAVMNSLVSTDSSLTYASANLNVSGGGTTLATRCTMSTFAVTSGKWYAEVNVGTTNNGAYCGVVKPANLGVSRDTCWNYYDGLIYPSGAGSFGTAVSGNVIGIAFDADNGTVQFYKNGSTNGAQQTGLTTGVEWAFYSEMGSGGQVQDWNFGQRPFAYTPPTGFKALNTQNLPDSTVKDGGEYFNAVLYTGDGSYPRTITGVGFQPDLVWTKARSTTYSHILYDAVRGTGTSKNLSTNETGAEGGNSTNANLTAFASDGFTVGTTSATNVLNNSGTTIVAWLWKANGSGVTNTAGTITSTVSANTTSGVSIVSYTGNGTNGATVGHGLGVAPAMIIIKDRDVNSNANNWFVWHKSLSTDYNIQLNTTVAQYSLAGTYGGPTESASPSTTFKLYGGLASTNVNESGDLFVAYCFAEVAAYSKLGSYTGNGSSDGPFVFTNFRPRFVFWKNASTTGDWQMKDAARSTYNVTNANLYANLSNAENSAGDVDFLSNGFKIRSAGTDVNGSTNTIIYAAFAENPFKYALAR